ncbi:MAG: formylglycine-generating enzyme family protein [Planctomycetota bacterium]
MATDRRKTRRSLSLGLAVTVGFLLGMGSVALGEGESPPPVPKGMKKGRTGEFLWERDGAVMIWVPGGPYVRGAEKGGDPDETPAAKVEVSAFFLDRDEVTNGQYRKFYAWWLTCPPAEKRKHSHSDEPKEIDHRPAYWPAKKKEGEEEPVEDAYSRADFPVVGITWYSAFAYARWAGKDLPSEAEWEKAASLDRKEKAKRTWPWGNAAPDFTRCNFAGNVGHPVRPGSYATGVSPMGARDMAGNVWEWCLDFYHTGFYKTGAGKAANPVNRFPSAYRVVRGGSYISRVEEIRTTYRDRADPGKRYRDVGFRSILRVK